MGFEAQAAEHAAKMREIRAQHGDDGPPTKLSGIQAMMAAGDTRGAILAAARLPQLGAQRDAILRAKDAIQNPGFQRQLKRDPETLIAAGAAALKERFDK